MRLPPIPTRTQFVEAHRAAFPDVTEEDAGALYDAMTGPAEPPEKAIHEVPDDQREAERERVDVE